MLTSEQLEALQAAAEAATPGEWQLTDFNEGMCPPRPLWGVINDEYLNPSGDDEAACVEVEIHVGDKVDAAFIAAANPAAILELLAAHRAALARTARVEALHREKRGEKAIYARGAEPGLDVPTHFEPYVICQTDGTQWPCATMRVLTEGEPDAVGQTS